MARILLGMSGGVDSSVAALQLQRDAHEVVGVTLRFHDYIPNTTTGVPQDEMAASVCEKLGIEHHVIDARDRYDKLVRKWAIRQYKTDRCPNVCAHCTAALKLPLLHEIAKEMKCRYVATGHYAAIKHDSGGVGLHPCQLHSAADIHVDQSFLLYGLSQDILAYTMFPLAEMYSSDVRIAAMRADLMMPPVETDRDPCLFEDMPLVDWLEEEAGFKPASGPVVNISSGKTIGEHQGLHKYPYASKVDRSILFPSAPPATVHVIAKDHAKNTLLVGPSQLAKAESFTVRNVHWTSIKPFDKKRSAKVCLAMHQIAKPCQLQPMENGELLVSLNAPVDSVSPGQTVVFYSDSMVLGGGVVQ